MHLSAEQLDGLCKVGFLCFKFSNFEGMIHRILFAILLLFTAKFSIAQTELRYEHYTIANGMSSNFTKAIEQDKYGFLWIATIDGLNCFNGYEFTAYYKQENDSNSLCDNAINDLYIDKSGNLWIATSKGLNKYVRSSNNFQRFLYGSGKSKGSSESYFVNYITADPQGNLWMGTDKGIRVLDPLSNKITVPQFEEDSLRDFVNAGISGIFFDSKQNIWLGSSLNKGFRIVSKKTMRTVSFTAPVNRKWFEKTMFKGFFEDKNGIMWLLSNNALFSYEYATNTFKRFSRSEAPDDTLTYEATSIIENNSGEIWVSLSANPPWYTSIAKVDFQSASFRIYPYVDNDDRGLAWSWASFIFQDESGIYWVGTSRGLDKMDPMCQQFKLYQQYTNLKYSQFNNIYMMAKDDAVIWLGTDGKGLIKYNLNSKVFERVLIEGFESEVGLYSLLLLPDKRLLLGVSEGVYLYDPVSRKLEFLLKSPPPKGDGDSQVSSMIQGDGDAIWIGFDGGGLMQYNLITKEQKLFLNNASDSTTLCSDQVNVLFLDKQGQLWIGTADGVNSFGGLPGKGLDRFNAASGTFTHFSHDDTDSSSLSNDNVIAIAEDLNGVLWVGTRNGGLNKMDRKSGKFKHYTKSNGLPSNFITAIQVDDANNIWMSTFTNGMARLNAETDEIKLFDISYGLQNNRFNRQATLKTNEGEFYFGGVSGFNSFYPAKLKFNTKPPAVLITGIKINNEEYKGSAPVLEIKNLNLNYRQSDLQFDFVAMNFSQSIKNKYAYQLVGYDKKWIFCGTTRTAKYTNLDAGNYVFKVKACNNDGIWNETGTSISIVIYPPWYQSGWMYALYLLTTVLLIAAIIKWRERVLEKEKLILENKVALATKEIRNEKERSEELLLNILPVEIAEELKSTGSSKAKTFSMVTVMFTDFKDFTAVSEKVSAELLVDEINYCFSAFDRIVQKNGVEKIKTVGDAYICVGGMPALTFTHAVDIVNAAIEIRDFMLQRKREKEARGETPFELRIGIHTGPVVAGIVGVKKYAYDIWGDTVNLAARMEQNSDAGKINISGSTFELIKTKFKCEHRGKIEAKNKGVIDMYFVEGVL